MSDCRHFFRDKTDLWLVFDCEASGVKFPCQEMYFWKRQELMWDQTTTMTLRDEDGFNKALVEYGLSPDMVVLSPDSYDYTQTQRWGGSIHNCNYHIVGFPTRNPDMKVANPKDIVTKGLGSIADLRIQMQATMLDMMLGTWSNGSTNDPAQAYSAPVFLLMQGVESMAQAKALGVVEQEKEKEDAEKQKELILLIVSVVLMVSYTYTKCATGTDNGSLCLWSVKRSPWLPDLPASRGLSPY